MYSYWLSYRTGVGGHLADGLAIHLVWFEFADPSYHMKMGTYFDVSSHIFMHEFEPSATFTDLQLIPKEHELRCLRCNFR